MPGIEEEKGKCNRFGRNNSGGKQIVLLQNSGSDSKTSELNVKSEEPRKPVSFKLFKLD